MKKIVVLFAVFCLVGCQKEKSTGQKEETSLETNVSADEVNFKFNKDKTELKWTAYKTPDKIGVDGSFKDIEVLNTKSSKVAEQVLSGAEFKIDATKVTTNNEERDAKIATLFFANLEGGTITGSFGEFKDGVVAVKIMMNGNEAAKDFNYTLDGGKLKVNGSIDMIADFKANKGFDTLHKACEALHLKKTWTEVSIEIVSELK